MKAFILIMITLLNSCCAFSQSSTGWYKVFTGKVGNMNATIHLCSSADNYSGYIWFDQNQRPLFLYAELSKSDSLSLSASSGPLSIVLTGILKDHYFNGKSVLQKENSGAKSAGFQLQENTDKIFTPFQYIYTKGSARLLPKIKNESTCEYSSGTVWPASSGKLLEKEIRTMLGNKTSTAEPAVWMKDVKDKFINSWLKENSKLSQKEAAEMGLSLSVEEDNRIMVMYENEHTITFANYNYAFTGGAHGNYATSLINLYKQTGKIIQLSDVLNAEGIKALPLFLDRVARLQYGITNNRPLDENNFFVKKIEPSKEFYITSGSIGFLFPPYVLKSFAEGEVNLQVPFAALKAYLQPAFKK